MRARGGAGRQSYQLDRLAGVHHMSDRVVNGPRKGVEQYGARFRECSIAMLTQALADKNAPDMDDMPDVATSEAAASDTAPAIGTKRWSTAMWMLSSNYDATRRMVASS